MRLRAVAIVLLYTSLLAIALALAQPLDDETVIVKMDLTYPKGSTITRHPEIVAIIDPNASQVVDRSSIRLYVNGEDYSRYLRQSIGPGGGLMIIFKSSKPLPVGDINVKLTGLLLTGDRFVKSFHFKIDPTSDPQIKPYYLKVQRDPSDYMAYYQLGRIYESKYLLLDAYNYYYQAWKLNPSFLKAKKGVERIFAVLGRKAVKKDKVVVDVSINDVILKWSQGIVLFDVMVENYHPEDKVKVRIDEIVLADASGRYYKPVGDLMKYVREEAKRKRISLEVFAKLNYYLDVTPVNIMTSDVEVQPMSYKRFTVAFRIVNPETKKLTLTLAGVYLGKKRLRFKFPFLR